MNTQINVRMPNNLLSSAKTFAEENGFGTVQEFIKEVVREKLFDEEELSSEEIKLVKKLTNLTKNKNLFGTEKELFEKLDG